MAVLRGGRLSTAGKSAGTKRTAAQARSEKVRRAPEKWKARPPTASQLRKQEAVLSAERTVEAEKRKADLWLRAEPILLTSPDGKARPLTFANDSELGFADAYRVVSTSSESLSELAELFEPRPVSAWTQELHMSEKQFVQFGLRKGVAKDKPKYLATELGPASFEQALTQGDSYAYTAADQSSLAGRVNLLLPELLEPLLRAKGYPVSVVAEVAGGAEVKHQSFETSPQAFATYIRSFHRDFERANTHLHFGLPGKAISAAQGREIAHSLETRTVLALAAASDDPGEPIAINHGTVLGGRPGKGTVSWGPERFKKPEPTHDVELRQWNSIEHGMSLIHSAAELAQNAARLRLFEGRDFGGQLDPYLGNISGYPIGEPRQVGEMVGAVRLAW